MSSFWMNKSSDERRIFDRIVSALESIADSLTNKQRIAELAEKYKKERAHSTDLGKKLDGERLKNKRLREALDVDRITNIIVDRELVPTVCEDSGQAEWARGEARKLAEAISHVQTEDVTKG